MDPRNRWTEGTTGIFVLWVALKSLWRCLLWLPFEVFHSIHMQALPAVGTHAYPYSFSRELLKA